MSEPRRGRKPKVKRNIRGLRNQQTPKSPEANLNHAQSPLDLQIDKLHESGNESDQDWDPLLELDSLKPCWEKEDQESEDENTDDENMEILMEGWDDGIDDDEAAELWHVRLVKLAIENEDDPRDEEWVPAERRKKYQAMSASSYLNFIANSTQLK
ncbi:hypothetical protein C0993_004205, partial [Termitomyces sp. T159_Od127]